MLKQTFKYRVVLGILLTLLFSNAFTRGDDRKENRERNNENRREHDRGYGKEHNRDSHREYDRGHHRAHRHYYRDGRWYRHGWFGFGVAVSALTVGAIIESLPPTHSVIIVQGTPYYRDDRYYYRQLPEGDYEVVPEPLIVEPQVNVQSQIPEISTVNIPNSKGGYTSVKLRKSGNGFIGPQNEYYPDYPTVAELKTMYGN